MAEISITDIENFINSFREAVYPEQFERLIDNYKRAQRKSRLTTPRYNIFKVLGVDHREVKTHSAFIYDLLNPYGKHDHGFLFLKAFLEYCQSNLVVEPGANDTKKILLDSPNYPKTSKPISGKLARKKQSRNIDDLILSFNVKRLIFFA